MSQTPALADLKRQSRTVRSDVFPVLGAHISSAEFQYPDNGWKEPTGMMANLVANSGDNKGQLAPLVEAICRDFRQHNKEEENKYQAWQNPDPLSLTPDPSPKGRGEKASPAGGGWEGASYERFFEHPWLLPEARKFLHRRRPLAVIRRPSAARCGHRAPCVENALSKCRTFVLSLGKSVPPKSPKCAT